MLSRNAVRAVESERFQEFLPAAVLNRGGKKEAGRKEVEKYGVSIFSKGVFL